ncbi:MAG: biotin/lipoyl-binding protein [Candidatus Eisenbacteria bacterium]|nr:biotin/lipoyl-binding protein [Candidatus Eisenbacteria bacterium]
MTRHLIQRDRRIRSSGRSAVVLALILLAALVLHGCGGENEEQRDVVERVTSPDHVVGLGRIEPYARMVDLTSDLAGRVDEVLLGVGDRARAGDVILTLVRDVEAAALRQAEAGVEAQRAGVEAAEAALEGARSRLTRATSEYERARELYEVGTESESFYEAALAEFESLTQEVRRLEASLRTAEAALQQAVADSSRAGAAYERRALEAPADGRLLSLDVAPGEVMSPEAAYGVFAIASPTVARCEIDELYADLVEIGQSGYVRYQGSRDTLSTGSVLEAGPYLRDKSLFSDDVGDLEDRRVREVVLSLADTSGVLLGARVECVISVE